MASITQKADKARITQTVNKVTATQTVNKATAEVLCHNAVAFLMTMALNLYFSAPPTNMTDMARLIGEKQRGFPLRIVRVALVGRDKQI
jgi:hypothetical protein